MGIGTKIKEYRNKIGYTQKDLADKLHVTYQAVSRWENDDVEPSIDTLKEMSKLFDCSVDDLFGIEKSETPVEQPVEQPVVVAVTSDAKPQEDNKPIIGVCDKCNKEIRDSSDLIELNHAQVRGRAGYSETLCKSCYVKRQQGNEEFRKQEAEDTKRRFRIRRIHSFIWPSIVAVILFVFAIIEFVNGNAENGGILCGAAVLAYTFIACWILWNNFVPDLWMEIASWSIKLPGVIFSLDFDGLVFLIAVKILFMILGAIASLLAFIFATLVGMGASLFVYPYAIIKNIRSKDEVSDLN